MQPLHLKAAEYKSISDLTDQVDELSVMSSLNYHADLKPIIDDVAAERERSRLVFNGGRQPRRTICIPPGIYRLLLGIAVDSSNDVLKQLLGGVICPVLPCNTIFPVVLQPCRFTTSLRKTAKKGEAIAVSMDTLIPNKDVTVTAMDDSDNDLSDPSPKTVTADADGLAHINMVIPSSYVGNKIKFRIDKDILDADELSAGVPVVALKSGNEVHTLTVTA